MLADKREVRAQVVGADDWTDIALLKVEPRAGCPVIPWGDSSKLKVAEWVLAIGNPFQLSQTVTLGIVSALGRANIGAATYEDFIQTDAAINPGNSGGALINARGELIGINTAIYSESGGYQGIGFAVPSNLARRVMDDLIRYGEVRRGSIGALEVAALTSQLADQLGVPSERGALVARMSPRGRRIPGGRPSRRRDRGVQRHRRRRPGPLPAAARRRAHRQHRAPHHSPRRAPTRRSTSPSNSPSAACAVASAPTGCR